MKVNRAPFNTIPHEWAFDPEIGPFVRELLNVIYQLRERVGGDTDLIEQNDPFYSLASRANQQIEEGSGDALATLATAMAFSQTEGIPVGGIILWSGTTIPTNWQICDGTNGTPDLRDKFIVGAGTTYSVGDTGGGAIAATTSASGSTTTVDNNADGSTVAVASSSHTHAVTVNPNLPPYYSAYFIMRMR